MQHRVKLAVVAACLFFFFNNSQADARYEAAYRMLESSQLEKILQASIEESLSIEIERNSDLIPYVDVMRDFFKRHMSYESLKVELADIYVDALSAQELNAIADFYETDVGKKMLEVTPQLMSEGMNLGVSRVQDNLAELEEMIAAKRESLAAEKAAAGE